MALIGGHTRSVTVVTVTDCQLLVLEADRFERMSRHLPDLAERLREIARESDHANRAAGLADDERRAREGA